MIAKVRLKLSCLFETEKDMKDLYYPYFSKNGLFDFAEEIITPEENENGIGINTITKCKYSIIVNRITCLNVLDTISKVEKIKW